MTTQVSFTHPMDAHKRLELINVDPATGAEFANSFPVVVERGDRVTFYVHSGSAFLVRELED